MRDDESELIQRLKNSDEAAQREVWQHYRRDLYRFLVGITRGGRATGHDGRPSPHEDHADAEDILAVSFVEFFRAMKDFKARCTLKTYLFKIAINNARDHYRKYESAHPKARKDSSATSALLTDDESESILAEDFSEADRAEMPELVLDGHNGSTPSADRRDTLSAWAGTIAVRWGAGPNEELQRELADQIARLPERYRTVISLRVCIGFSLEETARIMQQTVGAVKMAQTRALRTLREQLNIKVTARKR